MLAKSIYSEDDYEKLTTTFQLLIDRKCEYNAKDQDGLTLLHHAVLKNNPKIVQLLAELTNFDLTVIKYFFNC